MIKDLIIFGTRPEAIKMAPLPEELNRCVTGVVADVHFAPTVTSKKNLLDENKLANSVEVPGNTIIDALRFSVDKVSNGAYNDKEIKVLKELIDPSKKIILVTDHRRENHGEKFIIICEALKEIAETYHNVQIG